MPEMLKTGNLSNPTVYMKTLERFRGVDLSSGETACAEYRSPDAMNMMPDKNGYPVKRPGYKTEAKLEGTVHSAFRLNANGKELELVHAGTKLYRMDTKEPVYEEMADTESNAWQIGSRLWIVDGKKYLCYDGETVRPVEEIATPAMITISKAPNGLDGATSYKPANLLTGKRIDSFLGTEEDDEYTLSHKGLKTESTVTVRLLGTDGVWYEDTGTEGGDVEVEIDGAGVFVTFTVDKVLGKVKFSQPPGKSPLDGEDNVRIEYEINNDKADVINRMRAGIVYGVGGAMDRLFLTGNPDEPTIDRWSEFKDPAFFPDLNYGEMGQDGAPIIGYSVMGDALVAHKKSEKEGRNAFVRRGELDEAGEAVFRITNVITGEGAIAEKSFQSFGGEPVFLTKDGVFALTPSDLTGERYTQLRSYFLNGALLREKGLETAKSCVWGQFYCLAVNGKIYLLDNEQKSYESRSPNSSYQYEGYVFDGIKATALWVNRSGRLSFGTEDGKICVFGDPLEGSDGTDYTGMEETEPVPVGAWWSTPLLTLDSWSNLKSVKNVWVAAMPYGRTSGEIWYSTDKKVLDLAKTYETELVREYDVGIFSFTQTDFDDFTFNANGRGMIFPTRKKAKKVKMFQVIVKNMKAQPFGLLAIALQYTKGGRIKK